MITLLPFQQEDVNKFSNIKSSLCGSEMGTGKTHIAIDLIAQWKKSSKVLPVLIITPKNVFSSWEDKIKAQSNFTYTTLNPSDRNSFVDAMFKKSSLTDIYIMHWEALRLMPDEFFTVPFLGVVADEVHKASNRTVAMTKALKKIKTVFKLGMSGTATGDKPENLWSILHWLYPKQFTSYWSFRARYCVEEIGFAGQAKYRTIVGYKRLDELHQIISPFYIRHLKREKCCEYHPNGVMDWLPEKVYDEIRVDLLPQQRRIYNEMKDRMVSWLGDNRDVPLTAPIVIAQLTRLGQMTLGTPEIDIASTAKKAKRNGAEHAIKFPEVSLKAPSSKIDALKEFVLDHPEKSFVVFTSSKKAAYLTKKELTSASVTAEVLSGDTPDKIRETMKADFATKKFRIFIGVIEAVAEGVDGLQLVTDTAIFLDRSWRTIKNKQAEDRLHRGGQKNTVQIIDIVANNTVDKYRNDRLVMKWENIKKMLGDK